MCWRNFNPYIPFSFPKMWLKRNYTELWSILVNIWMHHDPLLHKQSANTSVQLESALLLHYVHMIKYQLLSKANARVINSDYYITSCTLVSMYRRFVAWLGKETRNKILGFELGQSWRFFNKIFRILVRMSHLYSMSNVSWCMFFFSNWLVWLMRHSSLASQAFTYTQSCTHSVTPKGNFATL